MGGVGHYTFGVPRAWRSVQAWHTSKIFGVHFACIGGYLIDWKQGAAHRCVDLIVNHSTNLSPTLWESCVAF